MRLLSIFRRDPQPPGQVISSALTEAKRQESELQRANQIIARDREDKRAMLAVLEQNQDRERRQREESLEFLGELIEAQAMCGSGPWAPGDVDAYVAASKPLREALNLIAKFSLSAFTEGGRHA